MKSKAHRRKREYEDDLRDEPQRSAFFACAECGTLASANSQKSFAEDQEIDWEGTDAEYYGIGGKDSVRMEPACPCGCFVFNPVFVDRYMLA